MAEETSKWITVATVDEIKSNEWKSITIGYESILLINKDGEYFAIQDHCTHDGGSLADGFLVGNEIACSRHGARFCIKTGEVKAPPAYESIASFPIKVDGHEIKLIPIPTFL